MQPVFAHRRASEGLSSISGEWRGACSRRALIGDCPVINRSGGSEAWQAGPDDSDIRCHDAAIHFVLLISSHI